MAAPAKWQDISARAIAKVDESIPPEWRLDPDLIPKEQGVDVTDIPLKSGILTEREIAITNSDAIYIIEQIRLKHYTAVEVTRAFCKRASIAHQLTRCLTVTMFDDALERAKELDDVYSRKNMRKGPLHGLPISIKDNFNVLGFPSSIGFTAWAEEPMQETSVLVRMLRSLGAIIYVKTNVPTAMMIPETVNNCYGRTLNPLNTSLTSGGSSGGESALIAMKGSPLGIGTDIGGSLRIPAACTGLFTLKPSSGRFPHYGTRSALAGQEAVASVNGPIARNLDDLIIYTNVMCDEAADDSLDPKHIAIPFRTHTFTGPMRIGVMSSDGIVSPTPPVQRALREIVRRLEARPDDKFIVSNIEPEGHEQAMQLMAKFFVADGGRSVRKILAETDEPWRPELKMYETAKELGVYDLWQLQAERTKLAKEYLDRLDVHAILCPTTPYTAPKHGGFKWVGYTGVFNILDYAAVSFPTGLFADKDLDPAIPNFEPSNEWDTANVEYDAKLAHGMPISLQLVCGRLEEEKVLQIAAAVAWATKSAAQADETITAEAEEGTIAVD